MAEGQRSHGRGGAGNINAKPSTTVEAADFSTPTIKSNTYTTGRGGQGNMATNLQNFPEIARAAQDVDAPAHHEKEARGTYHWGRGGEGNMMMVGSGDQRPKSKDRSSSKGAGERRGSFQGIVEKGKEMLRLGRGKQTGEKDGSAVEVEK